MFPPPHPAIITTHLAASSRRTPCCLWCPTRAARLPGKLPRTHPLPGNPGWTRSPQEVPTDRRGGASWSAPWEPKVLLETRHSSWNQNITVTPSLRRGQTVMRVDESWTLINSHRLSRTLIDTRSNGHESAWESMRVGSGSYVISRNARAISRDVNQFCYAAYNPGQKCWDTCTFSLKIAPLRFPPPPSPSQCCISGLKVHFFGATLTRGRGDVTLRKRDPPERRKQSD